MSRTITAENIGPVPKCVIELPDDGGVVELLGRNGQGKSQLLNATERLLGVGKTTVTNRDSTIRGSLEGLGVRLSVSKGGTRRTGDLEVVGLEHRLDLATFIDPQIDNPESADRKRIAALMALSGVTADSTRFHRLTGGSEKFATLVDAKVEKMTDVVEIAKQVKADLERAARSLESQADRELGEAKGAAGTTEGLDMEAETDPVKLNAARDAAVATLTALTTTRDNAQTQQDAVALARRQLEQASKKQVVTSAEASMLLDTAKLSAEQAGKNVLTINEEMTALQRRLDAAIAERDNLNAEVQRAEERLTEAKNHEQTLDQLRDQIASALDVAVPSDEEIAAAQAAADHAKEAVDTGAVVRAARRNKATADKHLSKADELQKQALAMRDAARATDEVLSELVNAPGLSVDGGRLVVKHPRRGETYFAELSMGERTRIAMDLGAARVGKGGFLVLPQEFWESLDPGNRDEVHAYAKRIGVTVITARAAQGEIRSQVYEPTAVGTP